ncbi:MAG TPA: PilZ domain-containing protein [Candidatus Hydrogenedentes bacterium]|nr:PilZ domain-containing protein [Candidatus Hydrogenedentota bacterium]HPU98025.1 PilZ domain-containing protein [Candidatus Hydrogenedentota bacterium]
MILATGVQFITVLLALVVVGFAGAVAADILRRRRARKQQYIRLLCEMREKALSAGLSAEEWNAFDRLLNRLNRLEALDWVRSRKGFNQLCSALLDRAASEEERRSLGNLLRRVRESLGYGVLAPGQPMESPRELSRGQRVWIGGDGGIFLAGAVASIDEYRCTVAMAIESDLSGIRPGQELKLNYWHENDARYSCSIRPDEVDNKAKLISFSLGTQAVRIQNRAYFRVPYAAPLQAAVYYPVGDAEKSNVSDTGAPTDRQEPDATISGKFRNISAGGCAILSSSPVPTGSRLCFDLPLDDANLPGVTARVLDCVTVEMNRHLLRCCFEDVSEESREIITRTVFRRQREMTREEAGDPGSRGCA